MAAAAAALLAAAGPASAAQPPEPRVCASAAEAKRIVAAQGARPAGLLTIRDVAAELGMSEALVVSALPAEGTVGVPGAHFTRVWESLAGWAQAVTLIVKAGQIFEVDGPIRVGEPSARGNYYNLPSGPPGLSGHLRPDLLTAIYGYDLPGARGPLRGVMFFGTGGELAFGVFVPAEGREATEAELAGFRRTWSLLKTLPPRCPADG